MSDDAKEKAKKLAAAKKKLKEFQNRQNAAESKAVKPETLAKSELTSSTTSSVGSAASNVSEKAESEQFEILNDKSNASEVPPAQALLPNTSNETNNEAEAVSSSGLASNVATYFTSPESSPVLPVAESQPIGESSQNLTTLQVLINEKAQLNAELEKYRNAYRESNLELDDIRNQFNAFLKRNDEIQSSYMEQQKTTEHLRKINAELQHKLAQLNAQNEDKSTHLTEMQTQMNLLQSQLTTLQHQCQEKSSELEMAQLRIRQLTDETSSSSSDSRVESLTQTQFMHEQQIRDLQAMVQQLTLDKDQSSQQYQNYVRHLKEEFSSLQTKHTEQTDELHKLQEREQQLVEHISTLEREIQKNIQVQRSNQQESNQEKSPQLPKELTDEIEALKEKINDFELEKHEFQLKIKSQDDNLIKLTAELQQKCVELEQLQTQLEHIQAEQPDTTKLLASMESDKVAASRAVQQNVELKKQLDELELRFVQLTNDKADLMNQLDSEIFANREMKINYEKMEEKIQTMDEKFKFKDEEMIRLSHENMELQRENYILKQQLDALNHYRAERYHNDFPNENPLDQSSEETKGLSNSYAHMHNHDHEHHNHTHEHEHHHEPHHNHNHEIEHTENETLQHNHDHHDHNCDHDHQHNHTGDHIANEKENENQKGLNERLDDGLEIGKEAEEVFKELHHNEAHQQPQPHFMPAHGHYRAPHIPTSEAVEKLQQRFTNLISQVADLTDEKQHLEHLVLQLQSETETIGEYIALYQHQRRILKQREYEKAAQTQLLQAERQQLREKITLLNNLVSSLGLEIPSQDNSNLKQHLNAALTESVSIEPPENLELTNSLETQRTPLSESTQASAAPTPLSSNNLNIKLNSKESQQIIAKIQDIITEIKENTKEIPTLNHSVDHLNCCLGKFEVV